MAVVHTSYQGVEVVESDPVVKCRHPKFGYDPLKLATLKDATLLALADGIFLVVCDDCNFNGITGNEPYVKPEGEQLSIIKQADSVMAHKSGTHWRKPGRAQTYTEEQVKVIIKIWLKWKGTKIRNWGQAAAAELTRLGFKPAYSSQWTSGSVSSLVRNYSKQEPYKNLKAGPMDDEDREALAAMVRDAANRESKSGSVAGSARITVKKPPHQHTPVDFAQIIASKQKEDTPVAPTDSPAPTLNFAGSGGADELQVKTIVVDKADHERLVSELRAPAPVLVIPPAEKSDFQFVAELADGTVMFTYKGGPLMVGKTVKNVEI